MLERLLEASEARKKARDEKRIRVEAEAQMHHIDSERATAERAAEIQARSNERACLYIRVGKHDTTSCLILGPNKHFPPLGALSK